MKCSDCNKRKEISIGMDYKGREKLSNICGIQPLASEHMINPNTNEKYGFEKLNSRHLNICAPKWCPRKNKQKDY